MIGKIKSVIERFQKEGLPIFFIRDPLSGKPSVSLTMLVISFTLCMVSIVNKFAKIVEGVDMENSKELLIICASLYFGRSISKKIDSSDKQ
jgi:hypothetical protein